MNKLLEQKPHNHFVQRMRLLLKLQEIDILLNIQHASGKKFQDVLNEAFVRPLNLEGELYIGIPLGKNNVLVNYMLLLFEKHSPCMCYKFTIFQVWNLVLQLLR